MNGDLIHILANKEGIKIVDLGCGKLPQYFYKDHLDIDSYDLYQDNSEFKKFKKEDILKLYEYPELKEKYDLCIVNHVFEHIGNLVDLFKTINHILKPEGVLYCSIPDGKNFTDIFYRLIHKYSSGGHINKWSKAEFISLLNSNNFKLISYDLWADDWSWLEKCYDLKYNQCSITEEEKMFLVNVFRNHLKVEDGFYYGWEFIFKKVN